MLSVNLGYVSYGKSLQQQRAWISVTAVSIETDEYPFPQRQDIPCEIIPWKIPFTDKAEGSIKQLFFPLTASSPADFPQLF